jgi:hypothetical protein
MTKTIYSVQLIGDYFALTTHVQLINGDGDHTFNRILETAIELLDHHHGIKDLTDQCGEIIITDDQGNELEDPES